MRKCNKLDYNITEEQCTTCFQNMNAEAQSEYAYRRMNCVITNTEPLLIDSAPIPDEMSSIEGLVDAARLAHDLIQDRLYVFPEAREIISQLSQRISEVEATQYDVIGVDVNKSEVA